jgi:hypothetical protein
MAGLDPAIHDFLQRREDVDARVEPGHDESFRLSDQPLSMHIEQETP